MVNGGGNRDGGFARLSPNEAAIAGGGLGIVQEKFWVGFALRGVGGKKARGNDRL